MWGRIKINRFTIFLATGGLLILGLSAVLGVGSAKAAAALSQPYCVRGHQTFVTSDPVLQRDLDYSIAQSGGIYSFDIAYDESDQGHSHPIATGNPLNPNTPFDSLVDPNNDFVFTLWFDPGAEFNPLFTAVASGACASATVAGPEQARIAYCSVAGNTRPDGTEVTPGTFLNLLAGQPATDKHYTGAVPAWYVQGVGLTCSLTPAQAALAATSTLRTGGAGDLETPIPGVPGYASYTYVPAT